ncbi:MAG: biotin/lipoyl-binding protein, partial [Pseudomonadota bacterium]
MLRDIAGLFSAKSGPDGWAGSDAWVAVGMRTLAILMIGLFGFGTLLSINGAVIATGVVTVESNYKTVQHLDGGIVAEILVRNGDRVAAGDVLIRLDKTGDKAELGVITERIGGLLVQRARLEAERDGRNDFSIPASVSTTGGIAKTIATQRALFRARMATRT